MPIYSYKCKVCTERFEELVPLKDQKEFYSCPKCGSVHTEKQFGTPMFGFKGGSPTGSRPGI